MKKALIIFAVMAFSFAANAQSKKDSIPVIPADSVKVISKNDLERFIKELRDNVSVNQYDVLKPQETIQQLYLWIIREYNKPTTNKKK